MKGTTIFGALGAALLGAALLAADAHAGGAFAEGTACSAQNKGDRYEGVAYVTFEKAAEVACPQAGPVEATIRLSNKEGPHAMHATVTVADVCNPCTILEGLVADAGLRAQILSALYPTEDAATSTRTVGVREVSESSAHQEFTTGGVRYRTLSNVVVTVQ
jgi:hypothetical protein